MRRTGSNEFGFSKDCFLHLFLDFKLLILLQHLFNILFLQISQLQSPLLRWVSVMTLLQTALVILLWLSSFIWTHRRLSHRVSILAVFSLLLRLSSLDLKRFVRNHLIMTTIMSLGLIYRPRSRVKRGWADLWSSSTWNFEEILFSSIRFRCGGSQLGRSECFISCIGLLLNSWITSLTVFCWIRRVS
jgi:hypothetical protein